MIGPAAIQHGYSIDLSDNLPQAGTVSPELIEHMMGEDLVVADLTLLDPTVWYGVAIRHAFQRPTTHVIDEESSSPFIAPGVRVVPIDHRDLDSVDTTRKEIVTLIKATESDETAESPISVAAELNHLRHGDLSASTAGEGTDMAEIEGLLGRFREEISKNVSESLVQIPAQSASPTLDMSVIQDLKESITQEFREQATQMASTPTAPEFDQNLLQQLVNTFGNGMLLTSSMAQDHPQNQDIQMMTQLGNDLMALTGIRTFESYNESFSWAEEIRIGEPVSANSEA